MILETLEMLAQHKQTVVAYYEEPAPLQDNNDMSWGVLTLLDSGRWVAGHMEFSTDCVRSIEIIGGCDIRLELLGYKHLQPVCYECNEHGAEKRKCWDGMERILCLDCWWALYRR